MSYEASLLIIRFAIHVLTVVVLLRYCAGDSRYRFGASLTAALLTGSSAALAMQIVTQWDVLLYSDPMPWASVFCAVILYRLWRADGNVAKMFTIKHKGWFQ